MNFGGVAALLIAGLWELAALLCKMLKQEQWSAKCKFHAKMAQELFDIAQGNRLIPSGRLNITVVVLHTLADFVLIFGIFVTIASMANRGF